MSKKVLVSGCFDLLHSGHIAFFEEAACFGDLYVAIGSDKTVYELKGRKPVNSEEERLFIVKSLSSVRDAFISKGSGIIDFEAEARRLKPDVFIVNEEGNTPDKQQFIEQLGIEYRVLKRNPRQGLMARSTTALRQIDRIPYRIDLAGGWLDQPWVSKLHPGPVVTVSLEPTIEFNERSGMATSTRRNAVDLWGSRLPVDDYEKLARVLFCYDNPPGTEIISGSQDAIGIVFPGLAKSNYDGAYWPASIERSYSEVTLSFVEKSLYLIPLGPRHNEYDVLARTSITPDGARALAQSAERCWRAILSLDAAGFGRYMREAFEAQIAMFPTMINDTIRRLIERYRDAALGWKVSGAGGGGYLILVADKPMPNAVRITIRRPDT